MGDQVNLSVRSELKKIIEELELIAAKGQTVTEEFGKLGEGVSEGLANNTKKTETFLTKLSGLGGRVANQLRGDFKSLFAINALKDSLKLSDQFRGTVKEAFTLSDAIRKLGGVFGIAKGDFGKLQTNMVKGLGEIGLSSESAAKVLEGLSTSGTNVSGEGSLLGYAKSSGQLSSVTRQQGSEGEIAKLMAQVIQARGGNVNDMKQLTAVAEDVRKVFNATGAGATETLNSMKSIFTGMSKDFRDKITSKGLANLAAASTVAGPNAANFIEKYLHLSKYQRAGMDARGMNKAFGENGINTEQVAKMYAQAQKLGGGDVRIGVKAATGIDSDEDAEGFIRLAESLDKVRAAQAKLATASGNLDEQYKASMGFGEAFRASINRVKKTIAGPLSSVTQGGTDLMSSAAGSDLGAAGVVAGGGVLAALLAGAGMRGIGGSVMGMAGTAAKSKAAEEMTGQKTIPVYVVNAHEMGGGGIGGAAGGIAGSLGKAGLVGGVAVGAGMAGAYLSDKVNEATAGTKGDKVLTDAIKDLAQSIGLIPKTVEGRKQRVIVETNTKDLKVSKQPTRGASF